MDKKSKVILGVIILLSVLLMANIIYTTFLLPVQTENQSESQNQSSQNQSIPENHSRQVLGTFDLPVAEIKGNLTVGEAIQNRRSVRNFSPNPLSLQEVSQLLWAAQGITDSERKFRAAPSAGHVFPLELYLVTGNGTVQDLEPGIYHYDPFNNRLEKIVEGDQRYNLSQAAHQQKWVNDAPISLVITGNYQKMRDKYPDEELSTRFVNMEAGHVGENLYLESASMGLSTVAIGSFYDDEMINLFRLPSNETPLYIYPLGHGT